MAVTFTDAAKANIQYAIDAMVKGQAYETPFDATLIESVAKAAVSSGFVTADETFKQRIRDNPFSTLLNFLLFIGA